MSRIRAAWDLITRNPEDGSPLLGAWWIGPAGVAWVIGALLWGCFA